MIDNCDILLNGRHLRDKYFVLMSRMLEKNKHCKIFNLNYVNKPATELKERDNFKCICNNKWDSYISFSNKPIWIILRWFVFFDSNSIKDSFWINEKQH